MRALLPLILAGCSVAHGVKPVGKGALSIDASVGGPITELYEAPVPLPLTTVGATYGLDARTNLHGALHPSSLALFNVFALDAGISREFLAWAGARPRVMADLTLVAAAGDNRSGEPKGGPRLWIQPGATASWDWGKQKRQTLYGTLGFFVQPWPGPNAHPYVGVGQWWAIGDQLHLTTELKWISPTTSSADLAPHYYSPGSLGAISFQVGAGYRLGSAK